LRAARQFISVESLGRQSIRGLSAPLEVFLLTGAASRSDQPALQRRDERSGFVGRDRELGLLDRSLERATEGDGCAVGLCRGGVGKSPALLRVHRALPRRRVRVLEGRALAQPAHAVSNR